MKMIVQEDKLDLLSKEQKHKILEFCNKKKEDRKNKIINNQQKVYSKKLASTQNRLWFLQQMDLEDVSYNMPFAVKLTGYVDICALTEGLKLLLQNNDSLRMNFPVINGIPSINISQNYNSKIEKIRVNNEDEARDYFKKESMKPFDLEKGPLYRVVLAEKSENISYMLFVAHHIVFDGISSSIFIQMLSQTYDRIIKDIKPYYIGNNISYLEFADNENAWLSSVEANVQREFWKKKLAGELPILDFPFMNNGSNENIGCRSSMIIPPNMVKKIEKYSIKNGVTEFTLLFAVYGLLLHKYTHMEDIIIGTPFSGRYDNYVYNMIGNFVNTLPIRIRFDRWKSIKEYIDHVGNFIKEVYDNKRLPFDEIVYITKANRNTEILPLYQTLFVFQNYFENHIKLPKLQIEPCFVHNDSFKFDISMSIGKDSKNMECIFEYNQSKIPDWMIENMKRHYINILNVVIESPHTLLKDIQILDKNEVDEILYKWNDTKTAHKQKYIIYKLFEEQVDKSPDITALIYQGKGISYGELDRWVNKLANYLISKGIRTNDLVGIIMNRSFEMVVAIYGIIKAGAAYVPIDPEYPRERVNYMIENADMKMVLSQKNQENLINKVMEEYNIECIFLDMENSEYKNCSDNRPHIILNEEDLVYMIYTSGSTGAPKGVMNTNQALANRVLWMQKEYNIKQGDKVLQKTPYCFDVSVWEFVWPLITGGTLVIAEPGEHRDATYLCKTIVEHKINIMHFVPSMLNIFLLDENVKKCSSLKKIFCSGEALNRASVDKFKKLLPNTELHNLYGPTEAAIDVTYWDCSMKYESNVIPIGKPIDNLYMYILDDDLKPVPPGVFGELYIGGLGLARGYYNNEVLTNEKFIDNPFIKDNSERIYQTGDIGRFNSNGVIEYLKRKDFQVKLRGQRIELGEIEAVLERNEFIEQAAALVYTDSNGLQNLMAFIVLDGIDFINENSLKEFLGNYLPKYMIPSFFQVIETMPLTPNGKVNRRELQGRISSYGIKREDLVLPRDEIEINIFNICKKLLGYDQISVTDNLIQLGAYSLLIAKFIYELREIYNIEIPFKYVYENPYIEKVAEYISKKENRLEEEIVDIFLDVDEITKDSIEKNVLSNNKANVFLTGATGFVGAFILDELQREYEKVYVLVRANNVETAKNKVLNNQNRYKLSFNDDKIVIVLGDLSKPNLGIGRSEYNKLASDVSLIIHNGAIVNYSYPYKLLRKSNVVAIDEITRLAVERNLKEIYLISSLHVFSDEDAKENYIIYEDSIPKKYKNLKIGYSQSKWAAEKVLIKRAKELELKYKIFRLGRVGGASDTGAIQSSDFIMLLLRTCMRLGKYPDISMDINYVPVDYVAKFIVNIANVDEQVRNYHIINSRTFNSYEVFDILKKMGINLQKVSMEEWLALLKNQSSKFYSQSEGMIIYDLIKKVGRGEQKRTYKSQNYEIGQELMGIKCPALTEDILVKYIKWEINKREW